MSVNNEVSPLIPFLGKKSQLQPPDFLPTHGSRQGIKITLNQVDSIGGKTKHSGLDQCESLAKVDSAINYCLTNRYKTFLSHFDLAAVQSAGQRIDIHCISPFIEHHFRHFFSQNNKKIFVNVSEKFHSNGKRVSPLFRIFFDKLFYLYALYD
ncbi:hypothetical protein M8J75_016293 [Diaphorina citri]|nr:hypothetical protein M8J75_016293 [Diaphorina citri]